MIDGEHYTVHEILPEFLKNQNTENPESGKSGIWKTSALPSIDKPNTDQLNLDKPISTNTNQDGELVSDHEEKRIHRKRTYRKDDIMEVFDFICELNPTEHSSKWTMNEQDEKLIRNAINLFGFEVTKSYVKKSHL